MYNDDDNNLSKGKKSSFLKKNNKKLPAASTNAAVNKLKKNFKSLVRYNEIFKNTNIKALSASKGSAFLSKLQNDIFSCYRDLNALAILVDSDSELKNAIQTWFNCEDVIEQCSMHAYNLYSYVKMFQYKNYNLNNNAKTNKFSSTSTDGTENNPNKTFKFKSEDLDSLRQIRSEEIHRLDSKPAMSLSQNQANNLSDFKAEKINMEGEKSILRVNRLSNSRIKNLNNSIVRSEMLLSNVILSSSNTLNSFALSSSNLAVTSSKLLSKVDNNK
jgi:tRNA A37 N6-isopentenylltransferase MiaA